MGPQSCRKAIPLPPPDFIDLECQKKPFGKVSLIIVKSLVTILTRAPIPIIYPRSPEGVVVNVSRHIAASVRPIGACARYFPRIGGQSGREKVPIVPTRAFKLSPES